MKIKQILPALSLLAFIISSCSKEKSYSSGSPLVGDWKFISSSGTTNATSTFDLAGDEIKLETILTYTSENPVGVYNISGKEFNGIGIGYDYNGNLTIRTYENGILQSDDTNPIATTIPPTNSTSQYRLVGNDSIYFEVNTPSTPSTPGSGSATKPGGCKYKLEGNRLTLFVQTTQSQNNDQGGFITKDTQTADVVIVLERQ